MLRRLATVVAATTALALASAAPALADHAPDPVELPGNPNCAAVGAALDIEGLVSLGKEESVPAGETIDVDPADYPGFEILVIVKGGPNANVFLEPPFHQLYAPDVSSGKPADISHYEVCGVEKEEPTPTPSETPSETPTETPTKEPTKEPTTPPTEEPTKPPTEEPTTPAAPKPVPTSVPAGYGDADNGSAGTIGLLAFATALAVGGAALVSRRFLKDN